MGMPHLSVTAIRWLNKQGTEHSHEWGRYHCLLRHWREMIWTNGYWCITIARTSEASSERPMKTKMLHKIYRPELKLYKYTSFSDSHDFLPRRLDDVYSEAAAWWICIIAHITSDFILKHRIGLLKRLIWLSIVILESWNEIYMRASACYFIATLISSVAAPPAHYMRILLGSVTTSCQNAAICGLCQDDVMSWRPLTK